MKNLRIQILTFVWALAAFSLNGLAQTTPPATQASGEAQQRTLEGVQTRQGRYAVPTQVVEGLGKQPFLIKKKFFNVSLRDSENYSDNIFSLDTFKRSDFYHVLDFNIGASLTLFQDWTVSAKSTINDFRYNRFPLLDFDSVSHSLTVNYSIDKWNIYTTFSHTDLYRRSFGDHFFQQDDGTIGGYYSHALTRQAMVYIGGQYTRQWAHPESNSKNLPTIYAGLITIPFEQLPKLRLSIASSYSYADFIVSNRHDNRYNVGLDLSYEFFPWMTAGGGIGGNFGDSNQSAFDYTAFTATTFLKFNYQF